MIDHEESPPFPPTSLVGIAVPHDFNAVVIKAAAKNGLSYQEQILAWAQKGAEHERQHERKDHIRAGRKNSK